MHNVNLGIAAVANGSAMLLENKQSFAMSTMPNSDIDLG